MKSDEGEGQKNHQASLPGGGRPLVKPPRPAQASPAQSTPRPRVPSARRDPLVYDSRAALPPLPHEVGSRHNAAEQPHNHSSASPQRHNQPSSTESSSILLWLSIASLLGLAIGITLAILLASGELDLPLKDVKLILKSFNF